MAIRIGVSGWTYAPWRKGVFYPKGLVQKKELEYASSQLSSIEINGTFYSLQKPSSFETWYESTPEDFVFSVKSGKYLTHIKRLKDADRGLANFFAQGILGLGQKLGPILWQLPPNLSFKDERFEQFFAKLPHTSKEAEKWAMKHTDKLEGRALTKARGQFPIRHAVEVRHPSFYCEEFLSLLRKHNIALVGAHAGDPDLYTEDVTADFVYLRMHGRLLKYLDEGYDAATIKWLKGRVEAWSGGKVPTKPILVAPKRKLPKKLDVFVYFDNEHKESAPSNALALIRALSKKKAA